MYHRKLTLSVTDETKNNTKVDIQQEDISQKNDRDINKEKFVIQRYYSSKTCNDSQSVGKRKDNKRVFIVGDSIIKHLNESCLKIYSKI